MDRKILDTIFIEREKDNSDTLIIAFSAFDESRRLNKNFGFYSLLSEDKYSIILFRDIENGWYFSPGESNNYHFNEILIYLRERAEKYKRVICIGSSMGGTGAILFGSLIDADAIIAFCPFVGLTDTFLVEINDTRHNTYINKIKMLTLSYKEFDLSKINRTKKNIYIYIGDDELDKKHAFLLEDSSHIVEIPNLGHGLINIVNSCGALNKIIDHYCKYNSLYDPRESIDVYREWFFHDKTIVGDITASKNKIKFDVLIKNKSYKAWCAGFIGAIYIWTTIFDKSSGSCVYINSKKNENRIFRQPELLHREH